MAKVVAVEEVRTRCREQGSEPAREGLVPAGLPVAAEVRLEPRERRADEKDAEAMMRVGSLRRGVERKLEQLCCPLCLHQVAEPKEELLGPGSEPKDDNATLPKIYDISEIPVLHPSRKSAILLFIIITLVK